ncbi:MAG: T9SS type A sorting domain-containing protein [FCB group bacterium]|nr:T9SS type A sorting domain-containing protein [FCB group bacterium]
MKVLFFTSLTSLICALSALSVTVDGYCYLESQLNHSGTKVLFQEDSPTAITDSVYTDQTGYYQIDVTTGIYDIIFSHTGCINSNLYDQLLTNITTFNDVTLLAIGVPITGALSGFLEDTVYIVNSDIWVSNGDSLFIAPGAVFKFNYLYEFDINGYLHAVGTDEDSIKFIPNTEVEAWGGIDFNDCSDDSSIIDYCLISKAHSSGGTPLDDGGGIMINHANPTIMHCTIIENIVTDWGYGGGISCNSSNPYIYGCSLQNNLAQGGGGINCTNSSNPIISYCSITGNEAGYSGGGINCNESSPFIENCTIRGNLASPGGGIYCYESYAIIVNTIVENNIGYGGIYISNSPNILITYCDFYNNENSNFAGNPSSYLGQLALINSNGDSCDWYFNIFEDPLFVDPENGSYNLQADSPCIDAGDPESPYDPDSTIADIGAFYFDQSLNVRRIPDYISATQFSLSPAYPNPFNPATKFNFTLPVAGEVSLSVYDISGRTVGRLINGRMNAGLHEIAFDGSGLSSGIYFTRLQTGDFQQTQKIVLVK